MTTGNAGRVSTKTNDLKTLVIGKIPGYNEYIDREGMNYKNRLLNNLTQVRLIPTGYRLGFGSLFNTEGVENPTNSTGVESLYQIGNQLNQQKFEKVNSGFTLLNALLSWERLVKSQSQVAGLQEFLTGDNSENIQELLILCTNDSTMSEVFSNSFEMSTAEEVANELTSSDTTFGTLIGGLKKAKKAVTIDSNAGLAMLNASNDMLPGNNPILQALAGKALGIQTSLPEEWKSSEYNNTLQLMIKLVSPSGDSESIKNYILKPLMFLILASSPITFNGLGYGYPMLWQVKADGLMDIEIAGISALTITRGGAETQFNRYNQPLNVDVRLTISPLVKGFAVASASSNNPKDFGSEGKAVYEKMIVSSPDLLSKSFRFEDKDSNDGKNIYKSIKI